MVIRSKTYLFVTNTHTVVNNLSFTSNKSINTNLRFYFYIYLSASSPISIRGKRRSRRRTLSSSSSAKSTFPAMYEMNGGNPLGRGAYGSVYKEEIQNIKK